MQTETRQRDNSKYVTYRQISSNILVRGINTVVLMLATILIIELEFPESCYREPNSRR